jgi:hypothetical protein
MTRINVSASRDTHKMRAIQSRILEESCIFEVQETTTIESKGVFSQE